MPILYALVARQKSVLAEYTSSSGNFPTVTRVLLSKIPEQDSKMSYVYDKFVFHYIVDQGITFLCMSDESTKRRITFAFLDDIMKNWRENYAAVERTALAFSMNESFSPILRQKIDFYNTNPTSDNISRVQAQIDTVKDVMIENIDRVLERGERIELLVDKTDRLNQQAFKFEKSSKTLKNTMYYRKIRNILLLIVILVLLILFIAAMICGFDFTNCK
mmetsp:Transcript_3632/g.5668  ORF Transcript_3632/g.5668 Transcript_3632/m.5668 type:complete len:218 (-) Transcript_3632:1525-2178(-)